MSIQQMANGRWRAVVMHPELGRRVSVSQVLDHAPSSFATRLEAEGARAMAKFYLRKSPKRKLREPVRPEPQKAPFRIYTKAETTCRCCGEPAEHLHHLLPKGRWPEHVHDWKRNGIPLCQLCHTRWHHRLLEIPHRVLNDDEFSLICEAAGIAWVGRHYTDDEDEPPADRLARLKGES